MFYLDGRDAATKRSSSNEEEGFGWWLDPGDRPIARTSPPPGSRRAEDRRGSSSSPGSSSSSGSSMLSCAGSDDNADSYAFAQNMSRRERRESGICEIELSTFARNEEPDVDSIETDVGQTSSSPAIRREKPEIGRSYTPERLIRSQEYRILIPSPRYFSLPQARFAPESAENSQKSRLCRKRLSSLINLKQIVDARTPQLEDLPATHVSSLIECRAVDEAPPAEEDRLVHSTETIGSGSFGRSSYDRLNSTWDDCEGSAAGRRYSLEQEEEEKEQEEEDTSGIQTANDWSLDTQSETRNTPMCLCDELAIASSRRRTSSFTNDRAAAINEVASILEDLQNDPAKATVLLEEEDRFCDSTSSHDQLTRLALAIETDAPEEVPAILDDSNNWLRRLRDKIERLQLANKEIHRDIRSLRTNFQCDERRMSDLSSDTTKLRQDVNEMRYLDDLLRLLQGELERISKRNWPFVLGHSKPHDELNLIV